MRSNNLFFLDGLRGLAALYVMIGHARWLLWEGYSAFLTHQPLYSGLETVLVYFFSLFRYGHEAVLFFFVLSGFVIHLRYARELMQNGSAAKFGWLSFVGRRARRIYPPMFLALIVTFCLDSFGRSYGYGIYHHATVNQVINQNVGDDLGWSTLFGNLAFLMQTYVPVFGSNGPLWSLKFEWWFYMFYPAFWWVSKRTIAGAACSLLLLFWVARFGNMPMALLRDVFSAMLIWWLGVLLADVYAGRIRVGWSTVTAVTFFAGGLTAFLLPTCGDIALGLGFAALISSGLWLQRRGFHLMLLEKLKPLGDMSYTLYVVHFPILVLMSGWLMNRSATGALPLHFCWVMAGVLVTGVVSYGFHFLVETPFTKGKQRNSVPAQNLAS